MTEQSNRDVLLRTASTLFRQKGYHGVGVAEILAACGLPKGSLYYHFPGGKRELAKAATLWTGVMIERLVDRSFAEAATFEDGVAALCRGIVALIPSDRPMQACPVASILQAAGDEPELRQTARQVLADWTRRLTGHADRLRHPAPRDAADLLLMQLEGAWLLALAEQSARPFMRIAELQRAAPPGARPRRPAQTRQAGSKTRRPRS